VLYFYITAFHCSFIFTLCFTMMAFVVFHAIKILLTYWSLFALHVKLVTGYCESIHTRLPGTEHGRSMHINSSWTRAITRSPMISVCSTNKLARTQYVVDFAVLEFSGDQGVGRIRFDVLSSVTSLLATCCSPVVVGKYNGHLIWCLFLREPRRRNALVWYALSVDHTHTCTPMRLSME